MFVEIFVFIVVIQFIFKNCLKHYDTLLFTGNRMEWYVNGM